VERNLMLALLRAIARSRPYRAAIGQLASRAPDDVWYDPRHGWLVTFALRGEKVEQLLLFALEVPRPKTPSQAILRAVVRVEREQGRVSATPFVGG
jgi:hypothetical protein